LELDAFGNIIDLVTESPTESSPNVKLEKESELKSKKKRPIESKDKGTTKKQKSGKQFQF